METKRQYCYILKNDFNFNTYNGYTIDPERRIKQHNGILKGGAKYTKLRGINWNMYCLITGFPNKINALQCEWRIKYPIGNKAIKKYRDPKGRILGLNLIFESLKWTNNSDLLISDLNLDIWIETEYLQYLDIKLPNIKIYSVDKLDLDYIKNFYSVLP